MTSLPSAGLSLKPEHYAAAFDQTADGLWFEVHPENYMAGGARRAWLRRFADRFPMSLHGVALSLAADAPPDPGHLMRLRQLVDETRPMLLSEHLAWSMWRGVYHPDLLPFPRTCEALRRISDNIGRVQDALQRQIAIENPSHYLLIDGHDYDEIDFLAELVRRTGCALLLDVNNVLVSAKNLGFRAEDYLDRFPAGPVAEIHIAGFQRDEAPDSKLLIDSHDAPVAEPTWALLERLVRRIGPRPILIERDGNIPPFDDLIVERERARAMLHQLQDAAA